MDGDHDANVQSKEATKEAVLATEHALLAAHGDLLDSPASTPEGLDRAACSGHIANLARLAMGASSGGVSADQWRGWILEAVGDRGHDVLAAAETCMRTNGLWPWPS